MLVWTGKDVNISVFAFLVTTVGTASIVKDMVAEAITVIAQNETTDYTLVQCDSINDSIRNNMCVSCLVTT